MRCFHKKKWKKHFLPRQQQSLQYQPLQQWRPQIGNVKSGKKTQWHFSQLSSHLTLGMYIDRLFAGL